MSVGERVSDPVGLSEVVSITRDLIRIDTSNYGGGRAVGESRAADLVERLLGEVGIVCERFEAEPGRTNLVARWPGRDRTLPGLLLHGHLDVVPVDAAAWTVDPFGGEIADGMLWGRGAVDMKNMVAMIVASVRRMVTAGERPERDVVLAFFADEEAGCVLGSQWMVEHHPEQFAGVRDAISEGGGYSVTLGERADTRAYLLNTGEKGVLWLRLTAHGAAGHASLASQDSAIVKLAAAVGRIGALDWPVSFTETTTHLFQRLRELTGASSELSPFELAALVGPSASRLRAGLQNVANVTMISGGYKENVIPESATATVDARFLPGQRDEVIARIREAAGEGVDVEVQLELIAMESPNDGELVSVIEAVIERHDPGATVLPHLIPGGTDAKALSRLGITGYGFIPLRLPADFDFPGMFHGVDERVPLDALDFGCAVLTDIIRSA